MPASKRGEPPFSTDANLLHISYEGCGAHCLRGPLLLRSTHSLAAACHA